MQIYEHIEHPCTTLHLTGRAPLGQLIAAAKAAAGHASDTSGPAGAIGPVGTAEA